MSTARNVVAVDFGAESGRLVLCRWNGREGTSGGDPSLSQRSPAVDNHLVWDIDRLWGEVVKGLANAGRQDRRAALTAWALTAGEWITSCLTPQVRASATLSVIATRAMCPPWQRSLPRFPSERIYEITGIQFLPFNTIYQLDGARGRSSRRVGARRVLADAAGVFPIPANGRGGGRSTRRPAPRSCWMCERGPGRRKSLPRSDSTAEVSPYRAGRNDPGEAAARTSAKKWDLPDTLGDRSRVSRHRFSGGRHSVSRMTAWSSSARARGRSSARYFLSRSFAATRDGNSPTKAGWRAASGSSRTSSACGFCRNVCANGTHKA